MRLVHLAFAFAVLASSRAAAVPITCPAGATCYNLTDAGSSATVNGAIVEQIDPQSTGTGVLDPFVQVGGNTELVQAYNTTVNGTLDVGASDNFNHELLVADVNVVTILGKSYYQFLLDVNQTNSNPLVSLDDVQLFVSNTPNQSTEAFNPDGTVALADSTLIYRLDTPTTDNSLVLTYALNSGSGSGDYFFYFPVISASGSYFYLYSMFGELTAGDVHDKGPNKDELIRLYPNNDGFEEWREIEVASTAAPEPGSLLLLASGLAALGMRRRRTAAS